MSAGLSRRSLLAFGSLAGSGLVLAGCGFRPVYMPTASGKAGVAEREMSAVEVALIPERPGQLLRQELQRRLDSDGGGAHRYDLRVSFWIGAEAIGIQRDNTATRYRMSANAKWDLTARDAARTVLSSGSARSTDAINVISGQYFAADLENETVQRRLAGAVADQVAVQLALYFRKAAGVSA